MASAQTPLQLYILGNQHNVQQCLLLLTGKTEELNGVWTVFADSLIGKGDVIMKEQKEHEMECDYSLELSSASTFSGKRPFATSSVPSLNMKRLKSFGHSTDSCSSQNNSNIDIGYESDSTQSTEPEEREVRADINAIVLEDEHGLHMKVASFMFKLFTWPVLIVLAIDMESTALELYESFIKELGILAKLQKDDSSKLLLVGMTPRCTEESNAHTMLLLEQQRDNLQCGIFESYFSTYLDWCEINQLLCKIEPLLYASQSQSCKEVVGRNRVNKMLKGQRFLETKSCDKEELSLLRERKLLLCFNSGNKEYVCMPDDLINEFVRILTKMSGIRYSSNLLDFLKLIEQVGERKLFVDAFTEAGVIHTMQFASHKTVHIMPLICKEKIPVSDDMEYSVDTNALRLRVELDIIPTFVTANIIKLLHEHEWTLRSSATDACVNTDSFVFVKQSRGLIVQLGVLPDAASYICFCGLRNASHKELSSDSEYELLRELFECELKKWKGVQSPDDNFISYHVKPKDSCECKGILKTDGEGWIKVDLEKVDQLHVTNVTELLSPWFSSKVKEIETEMSRKMSDAFLAEISDLFGYGTKLFFVSEELPSEMLSQIEIDNPKSTKDATFKMLLAWRKRKGLKANIAALRSAINTSSLVTVNLHDFDEMAKKHHGNI
ncbi:uncharacterized protein LOC123548393 [Mercenaria mercenaria]|uniref:uncharacterized protein LOC123548393 n=1 Tax=Mercenaria mercenaria TaxID=6596 RepID=UPI00234E5583|nr:uncharacterized protein LOC123548393 [Mercenaria mercenaria]XP_053402454.1 uncharacterized protein LOC123548393 [Mercenaria mercenaria]XP_053402455.1 uncharacterized protein LOC123548393 [Mercenaria mercenaria]